MIRDSGKMWNAGRRAAGHPRGHPRLVATPASTRRSSRTARPTAPSTPRPWARCPNVGLMAQKAEEYGSHDKTFEIPADGTVRVVDRAGDVADGARRSRPATSGGPARRRTRPIRDWVKLAVRRARPRGAPAVFWLDETRAHDAQLIAKVQAVPRRPRHRRAARSRSWRPAEATPYSLERIRQGDDTISVTGNVLRDYLTDLFPIMELGTSAKMLSIVPLMNGGGLFETGAGRLGPEARAAVRARRTTCAGTRSASSSPSRRRSSTWPQATDNPTAPGARRHARPGHRHAARREPLAVAQGATSSTTGAATSTWRSTGPQELAAQTDDAELAAQFAPIAAALAANEDHDRRRAQRGAGRRRSTSAATTSPTRSWSPRPCARARPSTRSSTPSSRRQSSDRHPPGGAPNKWRRASGAARRAEHPAHAPAHADAPGGGRRRVPAHQRARVRRRAHRRGHRRARARHGRGPARGAGPIRRRRPPRAHRAAHRAALPPADRHARPRPLAAPHRQRRRSSAGRCARSWSSTGTAGRHRR